MWTCPKCKRIFKRSKQPHSCKSIPIEKHFENKDKAKELFDFLLNKIDKNIGKCKIITLPCCIHLFGKYDFLAALPKKDGLEIRFILDRKLNSSRQKQSVKMSSKVFKICLFLSSKKEIDNELINWIDESYKLRT